MRALVADDAKMMRTIIRRTLEGMGLEAKDIVDAEDGAQAIQAFHEDVFDIVLTDWNMPFKSGLEVLQAVRAENQTIPVFLITTEGKQQQVLEAIKAGVTDYIIKPFEADLFKDKVGKHFPALK